MSDPLPDHARPIAWIDVETTDLDEHAGAVLEVGIVVTDPDLHETAARAWTVRYVGPVADVIARMHGPAGSGLLTPTATGWACAGLPPEDVDAMAAVWLREACGGVAPLWGGRNVSFDRRWCRAHLPRLHDAVHHRSLDETTLRIVLAGWAGVTVPKDATSAGNTHRVLADLWESLRVARAFRDAVRGER